MKAKLHKRSVESAGVGFTWDTELTGFGLKVTPLGKRVFLVQKRPHKGAKTLKRYTIGAYPSVSPEEARTQAKALLGRITLGLPTPAVLSQPGGQFVAEIERYYVEHCLTKLKPTTAKDMRYMIDKHLIPSFGNMSLGGVSHSTVRSFHTTLGSKHPYRANRVLALLSKFYAWQRTPVNPCKGVEKFRENSRQTSLPPSCIEKILASSVHPAIRLLALTGMRKSEVLGLRWEWVDLSKSVIQLPDSKSGRKTIYLSPQALDVLQGVQPKTQGWVFPGGRRSQGHLVGLQKIWKKTLRDVGLSGDIRIHDLRHHYASLAVLHNPLPLVSALLGHKDIRTTMGYCHSNCTALQQASQDLGKKLSDLL